MIDTHTHIYLEEEFQGEQAAAARRAIEAGVDKMIFPNIDIASIPQMQRLHEQLPDNTFMAMGLHPSEVKDGWRETLAQIGEELESKDYRYVAVGEIGLDLYWDKAFAELQMQAFEQQCLWALDRNLPIIIHCREALDPTLEVLQGLPTIPRGVMHSFGGTADDVARIRQLAPDIYFGINGIVTFKNSRLREVLPLIGLDKLLLETDAPYLAPVPMRGRRNESSYLIHTASHIATSLSNPLTDIIRVTTQSATTLFNLQ